MHVPSFRAAIPAIALFLLACGAEDEDGEDDDQPAPAATSTVPAPYVPYEPQIDPAQLSPEITNRLMPLPDGATWTYESEVDGELERIEVTVTADEREVWGGITRVVRDTAYVDDVMVEDTSDWYGQDADGNVWYMGEDTAEYEDDVVVSTAGSWEAGVDGALPGVVMLHAPKVGDLYRQEFYPGEAEDFAEVVEVNVDVSVVAGEFTGCVKTHDQSVLDPTLQEYKYYCPGIGCVLVEEGGAREELVEYSGLEP